MEIYEKFECEHCVWNGYEGCEDGAVCNCLDPISEIEDVYWDEYIEEGRITFREEWEEYLEYIENGDE